jgi:hypothetical protein
MTFRESKYFLPMRPLSGQAIPPSFRRSSAPQDVTFCLPKLKVSDTVPECSTDSCFLRLAYGF